MKTVELHDAYVIDGKVHEHIYTVDGEIRPGVSDILHATGFANPWVERFRRAATFGTALHAAIGLDVEGDLGDTDPNPQFQNALAAWRQFRDDYNPVPYHTTAHDAEGGGWYVERPLYNERNGYCGTPDMFCLLNDKSYAILDWKSGAYDAITVPLKMSAYEALVAEAEQIRGTRIQKLVVILSCEAERRGKRYRIVKCNNPLADHVWQSCVNIYRWKQAA